MMTGRFTYIYIHTHIAVPGAEEAAESEGRWGAGEKR